MGRLTIYAFQNRETLFIGESWQVQIVCDWNVSRVKRIWYLSPMRAAKVQASLRIRTVSPEPPLLAHISSESRGTFRQKARSLAPLNGWACAVTICHDGMLEDTNSLDRAHVITATEKEKNNENYRYQNVPKFSDRQIGTNNVDPDQTAPEGAVWSGSTLLAIPSASFGGTSQSMVKPHILRIITAIFWGSSIF